MTLTDPALAAASLAHRAARARRVPWHPHWHAAQGGVRGRFPLLGVELAERRPDELPGSGTRRRALRVDAHGVDDPVSARAAGQVPDRLKRVLGVEVDHFCVLLQGQRQPRLDAVHDHDPPGALPLGGSDGELPHRA